MLVLSRTRDESIIINPGPDQVVVTVLEVRGDKVRIGLTAPRSITIHRQELAEKLSRLQEPHP